MAEFLTHLSAHVNEDDCSWTLDHPLMYLSDLVSTVIVVPKGFTTDFASVPRIPIAYMLFGDRAHHESVIHDYLYRKDSKPCVSFFLANKIFLEAMKCRGKGRLIRWSMYAGVTLGGLSAYHEKEVFNADA